MGKFLSFLGSLGIAIVVTAVGALIDAKPLLYGGILLLALVAILWLWIQIRPEADPTTSVQPEPDWEPKDERDRTLLALKRARDTGRIAVQSRSEERATHAVHEMKAALLSAQQHFGTPEFKITGASSYRELAKVLVRYIDSFYPLLREGHVAEAIKAAGKLPLY